MEANETDPKRILGALVATLRRARGMSQGNLSARLGHVRGLSQPVISRIETGVYLPDAGQLEAVLRAVDATPLDAKHARDLALAAVVIDRRMVTA